MNKPQDAVAAETAQIKETKMKNTKTSAAEDVRCTDLFADLVARFGEENGGSEDFFTHNPDRIGCRYADLSMHRREDGWHYGRLPEAYPTPAECYAHHREDAARFHSANGKPSQSKGKTMNKPQDPVAAETALLSCSSRHVNRRMNKRTMEDK